MNKYKLTSKVTLYPGMAGWHFIAVDKKHSAEIKELYGKAVRGFGSIPIHITIGKTTWSTSLFPDKRSGQYLLPIKAKVRKIEGIENGDNINFTIEIDSGRIKEA